jgi:hypothetical protein
MTNKDGKLIVGQGIEFAGVGGNGSGGRKFQLRDGVKLFQISIDSVNYTFLGGEVYDDSAVIFGKFPQLLKNLFHKGEYVPATKDFICVAEYIAEKPKPKTKIIEEEKGD